MARNYTGRRGPAADRGTAERRGGPSGHWMDTAAAGRIGVWAQVARSALGQPVSGAKSNSARAEEGPGWAFDREWDACWPRLLDGFAERREGRDERLSGRGQVAPEFDPFGEGDTVAIGLSWRLRALPASAGRAAIVGRDGMGRCTWLVELEDGEAFQRGGRGAGPDPGMATTGPGFGRGERSTDREHHPEGCPTTGPAITATQQHGHPSNRRHGTSLVERYESTGKVAP